MIKFAKHWIKAESLSDLGWLFKKSFDRCVEDTVTLSVEGNEEYLDKKTLNYLKDTQNMCEIYSTITEKLCEEIDLQSKKLDELQKQIIEINEKLNK